MSRLSESATAARLKTFSDRHLWLGPTIWMLSVLYFCAQVAVAWVWHRPYSIGANTISDLGNTACAPYRGQFVCSPRHDLMNATFIVLGLVMASGSLLIYQEFTERPGRERIAAFIGFTCMAVAGFGTILVGAFPENTVGALHIAGASLAIGVGNLGILTLGLVLTLPIVLGRAMVAFSLISIAAGVLFALHRYLGLGQGGMERIAAYPETLWLIGFGLYISSNHFSSRTLRQRASRPLGQTAR